MLVQSNYAPKKHNILIKKYQNSYKAQEVCPLSYISIISDLLAEALTTILTHFLLLPLNEASDRGKIRSMKAVHL